MLNPDVERKLAETYFTITALPVYWGAAMRAARVSLSTLDGDPGHGFMTMVGDGEILRCDPLRHEDTTVISTLGELAVMLDGVSKRFCAVKPRAFPKAERVALDLILEKSVPAADGRGEAIAVTLPGSAIPTLSQALDFYSRLGIGQIEEIGACARMMAEISDSFQTSVDSLYDQLYALKGWLGHPRNGSLGILHPSLGQNVRCSWDLKKVCDQTYALTRDAIEREHGVFDARSFRGVNYDGLIVRSSGEFAAPTAKAEREHNSGGVCARGCSQRSRVRCHQNFAGG